MASYHFAVQVVKRSQGRSVVAMAAYRAGERLHDSRRNQVEDYSKRRGVAHREILVPEGSPEWLADREALWNAVERAEKRIDAQLAREINLALPHELTHDQRVELVRDFVLEQFVARGMVADLAIHQPVVEKGDNRLNHHAHILLTLRQAMAQGFRQVKTREWNADSLLVTWRAAWAEHQNRALLRNGHEALVDHRSLAAQRAEARAQGDRPRAALLDRLPEVHIGPLARQAVKRGRQVNSHEREVGPKRYREPGKPATRRIRHYPMHDRGNRLDWVTRILKGNDRHARTGVERLEFRAARLKRKLHYWETRAKLGLVGGAMRSASSVDQAIAAQRGRLLTASQRQLQVHADKRVKLLQQLLRELTSVLRAMLHQRNAVLVRSRELDGWTRRLSDMLTRADHSRNIGR